MAGGPLERGRPKAQARLSNEEAVELGAGSGGGHLGSSSAPPGFLPRPLPAVDLEALKLNFRMTARRRGQSWVGREVVGAPSSPGRPSLAL